MEEALKRNFSVVNRDRKSSPVIDTGCGFRGQTTLFSPFSTKGKTLRVGTFMARELLSVTALFDFSSGGKTMFRCFRLNGTTIFFENLIDSFFCFVSGA
jgi:hypothetical protein